MIVGTLLILAFSILGGLPATILTDAIQSVLILIGLIVLTMVTVIHVGGISDLFANTNWEYMSPISPEGMSETLLYALSVGPFYLVGQSTWQRIFAAKDEKNSTPRRYYRSFNCYDNFFLAIFNRCVRKTVC